MLFLQISSTSVFYQGKSRVDVDVTKDVTMQILFTYHLRADK